MKITKKEIKNIALDKVPSALAVVTDNEKTYKKYYLTTKKHKTMIVVNFYEVGNFFPSYRLFCTKDDYVTQDLTQKPYVLKRSSLCYVMKNYSLNSTLSFLRPQDEKLFKDYFKKYVKGAYMDTAYFLIDRYQEAIREQRLQEKHKKETQAIDEEMKKFSKLPRDYKKFVEKTVFSKENYLFFDKKKKTVFCTSCKKEMPMMGVFKHNQEAICPKCKRTLMAKSVGISKQNKNLTKAKWSIYAEQYEDDVLLHYSFHEKSFEDYQNPQIVSKELYRMSLKEYKWFRYTNFKSQLDKRWCAFEQLYFANVHNFPLGEACWYNPNFDFSTTFLKYSGIDIFLKEVVPPQKEALSFPYFSNFYKKNTYVEKLLKIGFYELAEAMYHDPYDRYFKNWHLNKNAQTVYELLDLSRGNFRLLNRLEKPKLSDLADLQQADKQVTKAEFDLVRKIRETDKEISAKRLFKFSGNLYTLVNYLNKQKIEGNSYFDYYDDLVFLGYDTKNKSNLYPRDFLKMHNEKAKEVAREKDTIYKELVDKFNQQLREMNPKLDIDDSQYFVRFPYKLDELKKEGEALHHCVARYIDKVAKGETMILFIREKEQVDKPFYTLEWNQKGLVQCRGFKDQSYEKNPKVRIFMKQKVIPYMQKLATAS